MNTTQTGWHAFFALIAVYLLAMGSQAFAAEGEETFNLATITCWDFTGIEVEDRVPALMMLYGYVAGKHGLAVQKGADIAPALERVGKLCTANPDMYVVSAIERVIKKT